MSASPDPFRLDGQRVLISGAGGGIGAALVARFTAAGAEVIGADRDMASLAHLTLAERVTFDLADTAATARKRAGASSARRSAMKPPRELPAAKVRPGSIAISVLSLSTSFVRNPTSSIPGPLVLAFPTVPHAFQLPSFAALG